MSDDSGIEKDEAFFLRGLAERPGDRDLLAVYGDWLEERNDVGRAAVVRLHRDLLQIVVARSDALPHQRGGGAELTEDERPIVDLASSLLDRAAEVIASNPNDWLARLGRMSLAGTRWEGVESIGTRTMGFTWSFPGSSLVMSGVFEYETPTGTNRNAHWLQVGRAVRTRLHSPAIVRDGVLFGADAHRMVGIATSVGDQARGAKAKTWSWSADRKVDSV